MTSSEANETDPLLVQETENSSRRDKTTKDRRSTIVVTSTPQGVVSRPVKKTAQTLLDSPDNEEEYRQGMLFLRRVWALLVMQYLTALLISSPFCLLEEVHATAENYENILELIAIFGIVLSLTMAIVRGHVWPFTPIALVLLTTSVGLEFGLTFAKHSWGVSALIALGQATTSFAVILALLQFDLTWLTYYASTSVCLLVSGLWILVNVMTGLSLKLSVYIGLGGWLFVLMVLFCCQHVSKHVGADEYMLAVLFILTPEALIFVGSKSRHPPEDTDEITV